tara:strand:+ start:554 stop:1552 length:999 start_codon:yes stop_codon:yes gene_type:complete
MTIVFTRSTENWSKNSTFPSNSASIVWVVTDDEGADLTIDEAVTAADAGTSGSGANQCTVGGQSYSPGIGATGRPLYVKTVSWSQDSPKIVTASTTLNSTLFIPSGYDEDTVQSVDPATAGYVNTAISSTTYDVAWWRYQDPADWEGTSASNWPWTTANPSQDHQQALLSVADSVKVDAGGTPLRRPILGQQLTVALTFASKPTTLRSAWRSLRGSRNTAEFLGDAIGEWLFTGANQRAATDDTLFYCDLTFYRDPFGWCRQRAQSGPNGVFRKDKELEEITSPSAETCPSDGDDKMLVASCVNWVQLHPSLADFSTLFTSAQLAQVEELIE